MTISVRPKPGIPSQATTANLVGKRRFGNGLTRARLVGLFSIVLAVPFACSNGIDGQNDAGNANGPEFDMCEGTAYTKSYPELSTAGEKIAAAITCLGPAGGTVNALELVGEQIIDIEINVGTAWRTPIRLMLGPAKFRVQKTLKLFMQSSIVGMPMGMAVGGNDLATNLIAADNANLPAVLRAGGDDRDFENGFNATLRDLIVDGNKSADGTLSSSAVVTVGDYAGRVDIANVTVQNGAGDGLLIHSSTGPDDQACCAKISKLMAINNQGNGMSIVNNNDTFVVQSEFENNEGYGVQLTGSSALRITNSDFGGNVAGGFHGFSGSAANIISGNQFGNNHGSDLVFEDATSGFQLIANNYFIGSSNRMPGETAIQLRNSYNNNVTGNTIHMISVPNNLRTGIEVLAETVAPGPNLVANNVIVGDQGDDGKISVPAGTTVIGNVTP